MKKKQNKTKKKKTDLMNKMLLIHCTIKVILKNDWLRFVVVVVVVVVLFVFFLFFCFFLSFIDIAHTLLFLMSIIPLYLTKQKAHTLRQQVIYEKLLKEYQGEKLVLK